MITVVSIPGCIWCDKVKELLGLHDKLYDECCLDTPSAQALFCRENRVSSFPQVFSGELRVGGYVDTRKAILESRI